MTATLRTARGKSSAISAQLLASMCCLLLLLPVLNVRLIVANSTVQESEESRQPTEEERSSEELLDARSRQLRHFEQHGLDRVIVSRGANSCASPAGAPSASAPCREHLLRNGVGGPLRC